MTENPKPADNLSVRDVADFHLRWREFRPEMAALTEQSKLNAREREILRWMILLADRVGAGDLNPPK